MQKSTQTVYQAYLLEILQLDPTDNEYNGKSQILNGVSSKVGRYQEL